MYFVRRSQYLTWLAIFYFLDGLVVLKFGLTDFGFESPLGLRTFSENISPKNCRVNNCHIEYLISFYTPATVFSRAERVISMPDQSVTLQPIFVSPILEIID